MSPLFPTLIDQLAQACGTGPLTAMERQGLENQRIVHEYILAWPGLGTEALSRGIGMSRNSVIKHCQALETAGQIERSADRFGGWIPITKKH